MNTKMQRLEKRGLLRIGTGCRISPHAIFESADVTGNELPIAIGDRCRVGAGAILYGGTTLGRRVVVEEFVILGKSEYGYAVGKVYNGSAAQTKIDTGVILRSRCTIYGGTVIGTNSTIGHGTLLRSYVQVGEDSQIGQGLSVERNVRIGNHVRCSPLSHITSSAVLEDRVFLGAGIMTINDKSMIWKEDGVEPDLKPPYFEYGSKIGSGSTIGTAVRIGREALVGSGSNVTHDIPPFSIAYGNPARVVGTVNRERVPK
jgi:acetyltransferase-like isoleucine patch superfamily enzyme